jgi:pilus assembly protein CpaF
MTTAALDDLVDEICRQAADVHGDVTDVVEAQIAHLAPLVSSNERTLLLKRAIARLDGLDALQEFLDDPLVDEVMVNRGREVWIDRDGTVEQVAELPTGAIDVVVERVLSPIGKRLDRSTPIVDARLPSGARLCAVVAPIALDGTAVSIRRHRNRAIPIERFCSNSVATSLREIVTSRANILVSGATSSGKTTLLAALVELASPNDRLIVIEDTTELTLDRRHAVRLEARPASIDGVSEITVDQLLRTALRLRPDRLIVGEFRGPEVLAMVQALNTGHNGSLSTCHANSAVDALRRVETLVMQTAPSWPLAAIRRQVSRSLDVIVHLERDEGGARRIGEVVEVVESGGEPEVRHLSGGQTVAAEFSRRRS